MLIYSSRRIYKKQGKYKDNGGGFNQYWVKKSKKWTRQCRKNDAQFLLSNEFRELTLREKYHASRQGDGTGFLMAKTSKKR